MRIYTGTGDDGETGLFDGSRVPKESARVEAYGALDELNSLLGLLRAEPLAEEVDEGLREIQRDLFEIGGDLATPGSETCLAFLPERIRALEAWMDRLTASLPSLRSFVLPGGSRSAALAQVARTVCRRAERRAWSLARSSALPKPLLVYLNRLSDLCFLLARSENHRAGIAEAPWEPRSRSKDGT